MISLAETMHRLLNDEDTDLVTAAEYNSSADAAPLDAAALVVDTTWALPPPSAWKELPDVNTGPLPPHVQVFLDQIDDEDDADDEAALTTTAIATPSSPDELSTTNASTTNNEEPVRVQAQTQTQTQTTEGAKAIRKLKVHKTLEVDVWVQGDEEPCRTKLTSVLRMPDADLYALMRRECRMCRTDVATGRVVLQADMTMLVSSRTIAPAGGTRSLPKAIAVSGLSARSDLATQHKFGHLQYQLDDEWFEVQPRGNVPPYDVAWLVPPDGARWASAMDIVFEYADAVGPSRTVQYSHKGTPPRLGRTRTNRAPLSATNSNATNSNATNSNATNSNATAKNNNHAVTLASVSPVECVTELSVEWNGFGVLGTLGVAGGKVRGCVQFRGEGENDPKALLAVMHDDLANVAWVFCPTTHKLQAWWTRQQQIPFMHDDLDVDMPDGNLRFDEDSQTVVVSKCLSRRLLLEASVPSFCAWTFQSIALRVRHPAKPEFKSVPRVFVVTATATATATATNNSANKV